MIGEAQSAIVAFADSVVPTSFMSFLDHQWALRTQVVILHLMDQV